MRNITPVYVFALLFFIAACGPAATTSKKLASAETYFPIKIEETTLSTQLALTGPEQQRGLMFRKELGENEGMLFLFEEPARRSFWMRNTEIPLDIGYFDQNGILKEIRPLFPFDETIVPSSSDSILIAVETNRGWFAKNGVTPGMGIDLSTLRQALKKRGVSHPLISK